jgi:signal transduction histidine kinase
LINVCGPDYDRLSICGHYRKYYYAIPLVRQSPILAQMTQARGRNDRSRLLFLLLLAHLPALLLIGYVLFTYSPGMQAGLIMALVATVSLLLTWVVGSKWLLKRLDHLGAVVDTLNATSAEQQQTIERGRKTERLLSSAGERLVASLDHERTLNGLAEVAAQELADWCFIELLPVGRNDTPVRLLSHRDPSQHERVVRLSSLFPIEPERAGTPVGEVVRTGLSRVIRDVTPEILSQYAPDPRQRAMLNDLGIRSFMIVPLRVGGRSLGAMTLVSVNPNQSFTDDDLRVAEELARRAAVAVDNARLYDEARDELRMRARAEGELRALNAELEHRVSQRTAQLEATNRELEAFSYSVSHDLRSPLRSIDGFSQALLEDYDAALDDRGRDYLARVRRAAQTMGRLIDDLLELARITRREMVRDSVDLSALAENVIAELREHEPDRRVIVRIQPELSVIGDEGLLRAALANLLGNAWKFTSRTTDPMIEFGAINTNGDRNFYVRDNGAGFDMNYANKLFGPFQRLHNANDFEGTGIGLATVQRVVNRHGGRIWAEASVGHGATFFFTLC